MRPIGLQWQTGNSTQIFSLMLVNCINQSLSYAQLLKTSESSEVLMEQISEVRQQWMRIQLCRVFRKYVSPQTPVEMLKKKSLTSMVCRQYGKNFRRINHVQAAFSSRPMPDEALCAVLWEYKDRGQKGYDLTEKFFNLFRTAFKDFYGPQNEACKAGWIG